MKLPDRIAGYDARIVRDLIKAFVDAPSELDFRAIEAGTQKNRRLDVDFVIAQLKLPQIEAASLVSAVVAEGYLDPDKLTPTHRGMGLAQHIERPPISRADANEIVAKVLSWAAEANARPNARIVIRQIDVFGSYLSDATLLGDIDLIVATNKPELIEHMEIQPEDLELEEALLSELTAISEYISAGDELDKLALDTDYHQIFPCPS